MCYGWVLIGNDQLSTKTFLSLTAITIVDWDWRQAAQLNMWQLTCVIMNLVVRSLNRPLSLDNIISSISPCSFSMTTNIRPGVSNMRSKLTTPGWQRFCRMATSFLSWASCLVGKRSLSITLMATPRPLLRWTPVSRERLFLFVKIV